MLNQTASYFSLVNTILKLSNIRKLVSLIINQIKSQMWFYMLVLDKGEEILLGSIFFHLCTCDVLQMTVEQLLPS